MIMRWDRSYEHIIKAAQEKYVPTGTIHQDNKNTILVENGRSSSSKSMHQFNVKYYFVTDQIKKGHVKVAFCSMQDMLANFFKNLHRGALFVCMQEKLLNLPASKSTKMHMSVLEDQKMSKRGGATRDKEYTNFQRTRNISGARTILGRSQQTG